MKKTKKLLLAVLSILTAGFCALGVAGCTDDSVSGTGDGDITVWTMESVYAKAQELGYTGSLEEFIASVSGIDGENGENGENGKDGVGIEEIYINAEGHLLVKLTGQATHTDLGKVVGEDGDGVIEKCNHEVESWVEIDTRDEARICADKLFYGKCTLCEEAVMQAGMECVFEREGHYDPTCTSEGYDWKQCTVCWSMERTNIVEALGHDEQDIVVEPTCLTVGYTQHGCTRCTYNRSQDTYVSALGHTVENGECTRCEKPESTGLAFALLDGTYTLTSVNTCTDTDIIIPATYSGVAVTAIWDSAFVNCSSLTSITIPDSVTSIGSSVFSGCYNLTSITIPDSVTSIGASAFSGCYNLTSITIPDSVTSIGDEAFSDCDSLTSVTIGNSVTSIGYAAFYNCESLQYNEYGNAKYLGNATNPYMALIEVKNKNFSNYTIHNDTKIIAGRAFYDCDSLTSITIPDSVTSIGGSAFYDCDSLTSVTIGNSVTSIGYDAFSNCDSLTSVTIGNSVTSIGYEAFYDCRSLTSVYYKGTASDWSYIAINWYNDSLTSATRYYYSENQPTTAGNYWHYDANGEVTVW